MRMERKTYRISITALFVALTLLLGMTPLGLIPLGFINVTVLCIPVIIGTILLGLRTGLLLGAFFGLASTLNAFGLGMTPPSALASALVAKSPLMAVAMCFVPRLLVPVTAYLAYRLCARGRERSVKAVPVAAVVGSATNTVFYLGLMLLFYTISGLGAQPVLAILTGVTLLAGGSEAVAAALLATPIVAALWKAAGPANDK